MFAEGVCWTPFPISIKLNVGEKVQTVPEPRIGRLVLFDDITKLKIAVVYGHVVYGVDIQDHDQRRDQLRETWNHIYVVPPLSAHAFCVPNTYRHLTILPYTPAPPMSFVATNDQKSTSAKFPSFDPTVGPDTTHTVRLFYVTLRNTPHEHPPIEITRAHDRVCETTSLFASTCTTPLERAGIDDVYDVPFGILQENCWYTTIDISRVVEDNRAIILHALLYIARFTNTCSDVKSAVPIYVAYDIDSMTSDVYTFKALPWQNQIRKKKNAADTTASVLRTEDSGEKRKNAAFATPPLYDYSKHLICNMFLTFGFQNKYGFYKYNANGSLDVPFTSSFEWAKNISENITDSDDPENSLNQQQQWFAPKLYNAVSQYTNDVVKIRYDGTTYSEKQAYGKIWSDVYWARMPDVRILFHTDTADGIPAFILQLLQCRTVAWQRLNWFSRYAFGIVQQDSEKAKRRVFAPDRLLSVYASHKDVKHDRISKGGLWFKSRDGTPRRFHPPAFGQYKLCEGVFVRDDNGEYAFTKDPKLATAAYTYGFKQSSGRISVSFLLKERGSKAHGGFYKIHFSDIEGIPALNGNYMNGEDISPEDQEYVLRNQEFVPCTSDDVDEPVYLYGKYEGEVLKVGEFYLYATHADGTSFVIPYKNVFIPSIAAVGKVGVDADVGGDDADVDAGVGVEVDADAGGEADADAGGEAGAEVGDDAGAGAGGEAEVGGEANVCYMRVDATTAEDKLQTVQTGCFIRQEDFPLVCIHARICNLGLKWL